VFAALLILLAAQEKKTVEDWFKSVPEATRQPLLEKVEEKLKALESSKPADPKEIQKDEVWKVGLGVSDLVRELKWNEYRPILLMALKGRKGRSAAAVLHALQVKAASETLFGKERLKEYGALDNFSVRLYAPYVSDSDVLARWTAVRLLAHYLPDLDLKPLGGGEWVDTLTKESKELVKKALTSALKDPGDEIRKIAKDALEESKE